MPLNLLFALVGGLWFWFAASLAGYNWIQTLKSPIVVGTVLGLLAGDVRVERLLVRASLFERKASVGVFFD